MSNIDLSNLTNRSSGAPVVAYRLVSGDEIIGKWTDSKEGKNILSKVRHVMVTRTADGIGITLMPWAFSNVDGDVEINTNHIMGFIDPTADMILSYQKQVTDIIL